MVLEGSVWAGKWVFIAKHDPRPGDPAALARAGFRGVWVQIEWQADDGTPGRSRSPAEVRRIADDFSRAGLLVGWWGWVAPAGAPAWQRRLDELASAGVPVPCALVIDAEPDSGWRGESAERAAASYGAVVHPAPLAVTSYGLLPPAIRGFTFAEVGLPQCYDQRSRRSAPGFVRRCVESWEQGLPSAGILPVLGSNSTAAPRMRQLAAEAAEIQPAGVSWFALTGLRGARLAAAAAATAGVPHGR